MCEFPIFNLHFIFLILLSKVYSQINNKLLFASELTNWGNILDIWITSFEHRLSKKEVLPFQTICILQMSKRKLSFCFPVFSIFYYLWRCTGCLKNLFTVNKNILTAEKLSEHYFVYNIEAMPRYNLLDVAPHTVDIMRV